MTLIQLVHSLRHHTNPAVVSFTYEVFGSTENFTGIGLDMEAALVLADFVEEKTDLPGSVLREYVEAYEAHYRTGSWGWYSELCFLVTGK